MLYELTTLYQKDINAEKASDKVETIIKSWGGKIKSKTNEGLKRLAYEIEGQDMANYYFYELELPEGISQKISSALNIDDDVLRYLIVTVDMRKYNQLKK